jgi:DNA polymerase-1
MIVLKRHGIDLKGLYFDTMAASYVLNPSKRTHGLDAIAMELFDHQTIKFDDIVGKNKAEGFWEVPVETAVNYACEDSDITFMAYREFSKQLEDQGLNKLFHDIEMPLVAVLAQIELNGICVDLKKLERLSSDFKDELDSLEEKIYALAGETFNIKSSKQLGELLFEKLDLPKQKKTKKTKGYSTDSDVLKTLSQYHDLPGHVLRYRTIAKLKSTYSDALAEIINPGTNRIHTSFNQTVTVTGRLSSSSPNLQNIPVKTEEGRQLRQAFIPEKGWKFISADYSQIELRILAHCAEDPILIKAFTEGEDIHTRTAAEIFGHHISLVTPEMRNQAKAVNFGIVYGMSPYGLSKELGISQKMAKTYIDNYFNRYQGVKTYIDETILTAEKTCETSTLAGRIRKLPEMKSTSKPIREFAARAAVNTPVQGTAADLIKIAMINVQRALEEKKLNARMLISVHDEIVLEAPEAIAETVMDMVTKIMENAMTLKVPLKVNACIGDNWDEAH